MENENKEKTEMVTIPEAELLSLVGYFLKDKVLFPEKLEDAREYLRKVEESKRINNGEI